MSESGNPPPIDKTADWTRDQRLVPLVNLIKQKMRQVERDTVDRTDCFGLYIIAGEGECGEASKCALAAFCRETNQLASTVGPIVQQVPTAQHTGLPPSAQRKWVRNRWAGTDKYMRRGYEDRGKPVDHYLAEFRRTIGELPEMPPVWHARNYQLHFAARGRYQTAQTASYHSVMQDGVVIVRCWSTSVKKMLVDVVPELVSAMVLISDRLGTFDYKGQQLLQMENPEKIPDASWTKVRPCTHRVIVRTPRASYELAKAVRAHFKF